MLKKDFSSTLTTGANRKTKKTSTPSIGINIIDAYSKACMFKKTCSTSRNYKNLSHITYFTYNKKRYYISTCTRSRKDYNTSEN